MRTSFVLLALMGLVGEAEAWEQPELAKGWFVVIVENFTFIPVERVLVVDSGMPRDIMPRNFTIGPGEHLNLTVGPAYGPCRYSLFVYFENDVLLHAGRMGSCTHLESPPRVTLSYEKPLR